MKTKTRDEIVEASGDDEMLFCDGLDGALIGFCRRFNSPPLALYDYEACMRILMDRDGITESDAVEFLEFNTLGAWVGERTPVFAFFCP